MKKQITYLGLKAKTFRSGIKWILGLATVFFFTQALQAQTTFTYTGAVQFYTVPPGVTSIDVTLCGGQGGANAVGTAGALGGDASGTLSVTPGEVLEIYVGGMGTTAGGWNGGGDGGATNCANAVGGGGGGASDIRQGGSGLVNRVIVAAGGGGAGGQRTVGCGPGSGGAGGGGYYGGGGGGGYNGNPGQGGTQAAGGAGGTGNFGGGTGGTGALGVGGNGGTAPTNNQAGTNAGPAGGAGGGLSGDPGLIGSPGWRGGGGGGGSSYIGGVTNGATNSGTCTGDGMIILSVGGGGGGGGNICPPPTIVCPPDMTVQCEADIVVNGDDATATPTAPCVIIGQWVDQPHITGARDCDGTTYEYTYHAADDGGNIVECIQTWTLQNDPPMISVPAGTTVSCFEDIVVSPGDATVTTSCGEELDVTIYAPAINGEPNCTGTTYTYTYRVEDQCEREATADRVFTIGAGADPVVTAPDNVTCECLAGVNPYPHNASVQTSCGVDADVAVSGPVISGPIDCPGTTYTYTYTGTDACDRTGTDAQTFTVSNGPPVFDNCPENCLILNCEDEGWQDIIQAWLASVTAKTSCGQPLTVFNNYNPNAQGVCISNGTTNVTWRAMDQCGRTSICQSMIIINDTEPPVFVEEAQDELDICNYNTPHEFDAWVDAHGNSLALDGCDQNITPNQWSTIPNNPSFPSCMGAMGPTSVTVTFVVRDDCGNKSSSTATFTALMAGGDIVEDGEGPASETVNHTFGLNQNQPNPFSNETVISFTLPTDASATLTIYDLSGKVVKLVQGEFAQGYNEIQLSRSELSGAGMLYYELNTANNTAVKKMIIVD